MRLSTLLLAALAAGQAGSPALGQALAVQPVTVHLAAGQRATTLTVTNQGPGETAIQIRVFNWSQDGGKDELTASDVVLASPPLATIPPGGSQIVRLMLRRSPEGREATYRILLDQLPPPAVEGVVRVVLRMSIPIFAQPPNRVAPRMEFRLEREAGQVYLVGANNGLRHEVFRDIVLTTREGMKLRPEKSASPYVLAGATRRWAMVPESQAPVVDETLHLTAHGDAGAVERQVSRVNLP